MSPIQCARISPLQLTAVLVFALYHPACVVSICNSTFYMYVDSPSLSLFSPPLTLSSLSSYMTWTAPSLYILPTNRPDVMGVMGSLPAVSPSLHYGPTDAERERMLEWAREERLPLFLRYFTLPF